MLRLMGVVLSGLIVASVAIPWVSGPQIGDLSLFDMVKGTDLSRINLQSVKQALSSPLNGDPMNAAPWAMAAFAVSFPLAALFALFGLLGYYSKPMALLLGVIPLGVAGFAFYAGKRLTGIFPTGFGADALSSLGQAFTQNGNTIGWGVPLYFGSAALLFLTAIFSSGRRTG